MDLKKVYDATIDPFKNEGSIKRIIRAYLSSKDKEGFLWKLRDTESVFGDEMSFPKNEVGRFLELNDEQHIVLFNKWMNDIRRISRLSVDEKNKFFERVADASHNMKARQSKVDIINSFRVKTAFNKISNKIRKMSSVSKNDQIKAFDKNFSDADVSRVLEILDYYCDEPYDEEIIRIKTNHLLSEQDVTKRNSIFFALNLYKIDTLAFTNAYLKKCIKYNIPYDVDIPQDEHTKQIVRINSTIENFGKNLVVIEEIGRENPEMVMRMKKPPVLCGKLEQADWIGIGTLSCKGLERTPFGFIEKRGDIIFDVLKEQTKQYIKEKYKEIIEVYGQKILLSDYLADVTANKLIRDLKDSAEAYYTAMKEDKLDDDEAKAYAEKGVKSYYGFTRKDLLNPKYISKIRRSVACDVDKMVENDFEAGENYDSYKIPSPGLVGSRRLHVDLFDSVIDETITNVFIDRPDYLERIKSAAMELFAEKSIDEKSCYEKYVVEELVRISNEDKKKEEKESTNKPANKKEVKEEIR